MVTNTTLDRAPRDVCYYESELETQSPGLLSSWLTGLMFIIIVIMVASLLNSASILQRTDDGLSGPMISPGGSNTGSVRIKDGNEQALGAIAGVPSGGGATTVDSNTKPTQSMIESQTQ